MLSKLRIQDVVSDSGMNLNQIAKKSGISHTTLFRLMKGEHKDIKLSNAFKLADALGVDINEFREEEDK